MPPPDALLTDTDQRILQWQRERRPDAEIAVRLGMTVGETKERIQKLKARLNEEDPELARWRRPQPGAEPVIGDEPPPEPDRQPSVGPPEKTYSRRTVIGAGLAGLGASAAAAAGALAVFGRGGGEPSADVDGTLTGPPASTPTAGAEPTEHPGLAAIARDDSAWSRTQLPNRGEIPYNSGIGFIHATNGDIDVMQLAGSPEVEGWGLNYRTSPSGRFVVGEGTYADGGPAMAGLLDRETGNGWSWDPYLLHLVYIGDDLFAFAAVSRDASYSNNPHLVGPVFITDTALAPLASDDIGPDPAWGDLQLAGPAADANLFLLLRYGSSQPYIFDLDTGNVVRGETIPGTDRPYAIAPQSPPDAVGLLVDRVQNNTSAPYPVRLDFDRAGQIVRESGINERTVDLVRSYPYSPDGRWMVRQDALRETSHSLGDQEIWSYVEVQEAETGRAEFRVLSGLLASGNPWLADSSAFIVQSGRSDVEFANYNEFRRNRAHYLVDPETRSLGILDPVPDDLSFSPLASGVAASPNDPNLFAFGGTVVHNRRTGKWFGPSNFDHPTWGHWTDEGAELQFTFPPGRYAMGWGTILPPYIEEAPDFRTDVTLQIARAGTCVNLRSGPSKDADIVDCLADGTLFTVIEPSEPLPNEEFSDFRNGRPAFWSTDGYDDDDPDEDTFQMYVHGRTQSGATGWVAIQYLDWAV